MTPQNSTSIKIESHMTLRNMLGPHHLEMGESLLVPPSQFYKDKCIWNKNSDWEWNDEYCIVDMSVEND